MVERSFCRSGLGFCCGGWRERISIRDEVRRPVASDRERLGGHVPDVERQQVDVRRAIVLSKWVGFRSLLSCNPLAELLKPSSNLRLDRLRRDSEPFRDLADRVAMSPAKHTDFATPVGHLGQHLINGCGKLRELGVRVGRCGVERYHIVGRTLTRCSLPP